MKNATNAKNGVQTPSSRAAPDVSSPSGTSRANTFAKGIAIRCR